MHSYLKAVGFSQVTRRSEVKEIIRDVIANYDEKVCVENHPEGVFVQFSKNYGCDCGISVCGQYDENGEFHVEYYFPFFRGTGITSREKVTVEQHCGCAEQPLQEVPAPSGPLPWPYVPRNGPYLHIFRQGC